jgi:hypothetical protein
MVLFVLRANTLPLTFGSNAHFHPPFAAKTKPRWINIYAGSSCRAAKNQQWGPT